MAELGPKNKHKVSAKSLANLRPNPQHMRPHGRKKTREYVTSPELEFLNYVLDGANHTDAAHRAGLSKGINLTSLMKRPLIDQTFAELQEKRENQSVEMAERRREERSLCSSLSSLFSLCRFFRSTSSWRRSHSISRERRRFAVQL
jgi:hypothetical protein